MLGLACTAAPPDPRQALPSEVVARLADLLAMIEATGVWPRELLQAYVALIPKASGGSRPQDQRPIAVLDVLYRLWVKGATLAWAPVLHGDYLGASVCWGSAPRRAPATWPSCCPTSSACSPDPPPRRLLRGSVDPERDFSAGPAAQSPLFSPASWAEAAPSWTCSWSSPQISGTSPSGPLALRAGPLPVRPPARQPSGAPPGRTGVGGTRGHGRGPLPHSSIPLPRPLAHLLVLSTTPAPRPPPGLPIRPRRLP